MAEKILIIGGGVAGCEAAFAARKNSQEAEITIFSAEDYFPYRRPVLPGTINTAPGSNFWLKKEEVFKENNIRFRPETEVTAVDRKKRCISTADNEVFEYTKLCFATGAVARMPQLEGVGLSGVSGCRFYDDFQKIAAMLKPGMETVVVGGGVLGLEVAYALHNARAKVTVVEFSSRLLPKQLSSSASELLLERITEEGQGNINILCGAAVSAFRGSDGKINAVLLADGRVIPADFAAVAIGVVPEISLAKAAGLTTDNRGILIGHDCRCIGEEDIFACGDCALLENFNPGLFPVAQEQGKTAGCNMAGVDCMTEIKNIPVRLPAFGVKMLSLGDVSAADAVECISEDRKTFKGIYFKDNRCCGAILLGDLSGQNRIAEIVNSAMPRKEALEAGGLAV